MLTINFHPFKNLESDRLFLRRIDLGDAAQMLALKGDAENMKFVPRPLITTMTEAEENIKMFDSKIESNEGINWAITLKHSTELIGIIGLYKIDVQNFRSEIGYMILPEHQSKGITSEAVRLVLNYGFSDLHLHSIEAIVDPEHTASARVLEKNGFVKEGHLKENEYFDGRFWDSVIYSLLKRNFEADLL
jgi:ribosomal-protein-alanine N-acetyltransferase